MLHLKEFSQGHASKSPVLFIPGAFCHGDIWHHTFAPYFAEMGHPTYTLTFSAHGGHRLQHAFKGVSWYINDVRRSLDRLGQDTLVIAHSTGALHLLRVLMERDVRAAALLSPAPAKGFQSLVRHWWKRSAIDTAKWLSLAIEHRARHLGNAPSGVYSNTVIETEEAYVDQQLNYESLTAMLQLLPPQDIAPERIHTPLFCISATGDDVIPSELVEEFAKDLMATHKCYEGLSHSFQAEAEWITIANDIHHWATTVKPLNNKQYCYA